MEAEFVTARLPGGRGLVTPDDKGRRAWKELVASGSGRVLRVMDIRLTPETSLGRVLINTPPTKAAEMGQLYSELAKAL